MNSIHFHFNGDVNINLSLPDSADRPGYKKLVDSLEEYLHDAAEEAAVTEAEADSIVMVMRPDKTPEVMQETQCWDEIESRGKYDCLEVVSDDALDVAGLAIVFDGRRVLNLGQERYLLGPVIVYKYDEDGDGVSLSAEDVIAAVVYFADHTVTLYADGKDFPAFHMSCGARCSDWPPCCRNSISSWPCRVQAKSPDRSLWRNSAMCAGSPTRALWWPLRVWTHRLSSPAPLMPSPAVSPSAAHPICEKRCLWSSVRSSSTPTQPIPYFSSWTKSGPRASTFTSTLWPALPSSSASTTPGSRRT